MRRKAAEIKKQAAQRLYDASVSVNQIAVRLELSTRQIRRYLKGYLSSAESLQQLRRMFIYQPSTSSIKQNGHEPSGDMSFEHEHEQHSISIGEVMGQYQEYERYCLCVAGIP